MNKPITLLALNNPSADDRLFSDLKAIGGESLRFTQVKSLEEIFHSLQQPLVPDLILLDNEVNGQTAHSFLPQLLSQISPKISSIPTIVLLQPGEENQIDSLLEAGAAECLLKPSLSADTLWRAIRSAVHLRRAQEYVDKERHAYDEALRKNEERLRLLYNTISSPNLSFDQKLDQLLAVGCREFEMERGFVMRLSSDAIHVIHSFPSDNPLTAGDQWPIEDTFCHEILHQEDAFSIEHIGNSEWKTHRAYAVFHQESYLGAAVASNGAQWGALAFTDSKPHTPPFDSGDKEYIRLMAQWIGGETERALAEEDLRRSEKRYRSLVDATAQIVWTTSAQGEFVTDQQAWSQFTGQSPAESLGWGWLSAIHPHDQWQTAETWSDAIRRVATYRMQHRVRRHDGVYRTFSVRAVPVIEDDATIREWVGVHTDITERTEAEERLGLLAEASTLLTSSAAYEQTLTELARMTVPQFADWCAIYLIDSHGTLREVVTAHEDPKRMADAQAWRQSHSINLQAPNGAPRVIRTGRPELVSEITDEMLEANIADAESREMTRLLGIRSYLCVPLTARGRTLGAITMLTAESGRRYGEADLELAQEIARRAAVAVDNAQLYQEVRARAEREQMVNRIGRMLRSTLDADEVIRIATREVGVALGVSRCILFTLNSQQNSFQTAAPQYAAPGIIPVAANVPLHVYPAAFLSRWQAGESVVVSDTQTHPETSGREGPWPYSGGMRAFLACPITLRGQWAGLLTVHQNGEPREWTADEEALVAAIADTLALAMENARLYAREHRVADNLQAAFLPDITDQLGDLDLAITYSSGLEEAQVGGDLYDAFPLSDGRVALIIADVSGKGLGAAVQTATVKYSLRAFAAEAASPGLVIRRLNRTLCSEASGLGEHFVTLFYAVYDPHTGRLAYVSAGHETQLIKRAYGGVTALQANGPILGIIEHRYEQDVNYLYPGDSLILFTDGLTEARQVGTRDLLETDRIIQAVDKMESSYGPGAIVIALENLAKDWTAGKPQDDMALLVAQRALPASASQATEGDLVAPSLAVPEEQLFGFAFPSSPEYAAEVRQAVGHWMDLLGFGLNQIEDFQTAVTEAVTNAVRHGSPQGSSDNFFITGTRRGADTFLIEIVDNGPGLRFPLQPNEMPPPDAPGGRGLPLIYALSDEVALLPSEKGLRLRMAKFSSPPTDPSAALPAGLLNPLC